VSIKRKNYKCSGDRRWRRGKRGDGKREKHELIESYIFRDVGMICWYVKTILTLVYSKVS
jgi:hypothetical protein